MWEKENCEEKIYRYNDKKKDYEREIESWIKEREKITIKRTFAEKY